MKTSEVLNKAADLIQERGWTQGDGWVMGGEESGASLCLEGGIMAALGLRIEEGIDDLQFAPLFACPAYKAVMAHLDREEATASEYGFGGQPLYWWNDEFDRTADEVIEVLRAAAVIEAAREEQDAAWSTYAEQVSA